MKVKMIEKWIGTFQAKDAMQFTGRDGKPVNIEAQPEREAVCALVEVQDGSGIRVEVELPNYKYPIEVGSILDVECRDISNILGRNIKVKNINRIYNEKTKKQI